MNKVGKMKLANASIKYNYRYTNNIFITIVSLSSI